MTHKELSALAHLSTPDRREKLVKRINKRLQDRKLRVSRKHFSDTPFMLVGSDSRVPMTARDVASLATKIGAI